MVTYLVDFENVQDLGLTGIHSLTENDCVYIIYTAFANKVNMDFLCDITAKLSVVKVESGDQSLDMHIATFLGYLIGLEKDDMDEYVIVSQDNHFSTVANFWCTRFFLEKVSLTPSICGKPLCELRPQKGTTSPSVASDKEELGQYIRSIILQHGSFEYYGKMMLVSSMCTYLNSYPAFQRVKAQSGMKPMQIISSYTDLVEMKIMNNTNWVLLKETKYNKPPTIVKTTSVSADENQAEGGSHEIAPYAAIHEGFQPDSAFNLEIASGASNPDENAVHQASTADDESIAAMQEKEENADASPDSESTANETPDETMLYDVQVFNEVKTALTAAKINPEISERAAKIASETAASGEDRIRIYRELTREYGRKTGSELYKIIKFKI